MNKNILIPFLFLFSLLIPSVHAVYLLNDTFEAPEVGYDVNNAWTINGDGVNVTTYAHSGNQALNISVTNQYIYTTMNMTTNTTCAIYYARTANDPPFFDGRDQIRRGIFTQLDGNAFLGTMVAASDTNYIAGEYSGVQNDTGIPAFNNTYDRIAISHLGNGTLRYYINDVKAFELAGKDNDLNTIWIGPQGGSQEDTILGDALYDDLLCWQGDYTDEPSMMAPPDTTPPATITTLTSTNRTNETITWNWTNPTDEDFDSTIINLDNVNLINLTTPNHNITLTGFQANTTHTIRIYTKDTTGNVNDTNVSDSVTTLESQNFPPVINSVSINTTTGGTGFTQALNQTLDSIIADVTDQEGDSLSVKATLTRPSSTIEFQNQTMTLTTGSIYVHQSFTLFNETGNWIFDVTANDGTNQVFNISVLNVTCAPSYACNGYAACQVNDNRSCNSVTDLNFCGETYTGNYSEFSLQSCNYCTSTYSGPTNGLCILGFRNITYSYTNTCCAQTGLGSDCNIPLNTTNNACTTGGYNATYDGTDTAPILIDSANKAAKNLGDMAGIIGITLAIVGVMIAGAWILA